MQYLSGLDELYRKHADPQQALPMAKYMKDHFDFFGLRSPIRKELDRTVLKKHGKPEIEQLSKVIRQAYQKPQREFQYFMVSLTEKMTKKLPAEFIDAAHFMIITKSWWDTVDAIAADIAGKLVMMYPELVQTMDEWVEADNMWLQRTAIIH